jgi:hypothetical protein
MPALIDTDKPRRPDGQVVVNHGKMRHDEEKSPYGTTDSLQEAGPKPVTRTPFLRYHLK